MPHAGCCLTTRSNRRRLSAAKATEATGREPTAHLWGNHLLMVLADGDGGSEALREELRQELAKVCARLTRSLRPSASFPCGSNSIPLFSTLIVAE